MIEGQFAFAFTAGMVAVANPCGFAMLPAYLSFFLGVEGPGDDARAGALAGPRRRALPCRVGFAATFAVVDRLVIAHLTGDVLEWSPWISVGIGVAVVVLGVCLLAGPRARRSACPASTGAARSGGVGRWSLYGVSYAVVSLGCTLPIVPPRRRRARSGPRTGVSAAAMFLAYALGFTAAAHGADRRHRPGPPAVCSSPSAASLPYVQRISGGLHGRRRRLRRLLRLVRAARTSARRTPSSTGSPAGPTTIAAWISDVGASALGLVLALVVAAAALAVATRRRTPPDRAR